MRCTDQFESNASASRELNVSLNGQHLKPEFQPVYLVGDRTLSYRAHVSKNCVNTLLNVQNREPSSGQS